MARALRTRQGQHVGCMRFAGAFTEAAVATTYGSTRVRPARAIASLIKWLIAYAMQDSSAKHFPTQ